MTAKGRLCWAWPADSGLCARELVQIRSYQARMGRLTVYRPCSNSTMDNTSPCISWKARLRSEARVSIVAGKREGSNPVGSAPKRVREVDSIERNQIKPAMASASSVLARPDVGWSSPFVGSRLTSSLPHTFCNFFASITLFRAKAERMKSLPTVSSGTAAMASCSFLYCRGGRLSQHSKTLLAAMAKGKAVTTDRGQ